MLILLTIVLNNQKKKTYKEKCMASGPQRFAYLADSVTSLAIRIKVKPYLVWLNCFCNRSLYIRGPQAPMGPASVACGMSVACQKQGCANK